MRVGFGGTRNGMTARKVMRVALVEAKTDRFEELWEQYQKAAGPEAEKRFFGELMGTWND